MRSKPSNVARAACSGIRVGRHSLASVAILWTSLFLSACNGDDQSSNAKGAEAARPEPKTVATVQPKIGSVTRYLYETGTAKALDSVDLTARVAGFLKTIDYRDGARVNAGQRLFLIEPDQYEAQVEQAKASVEQAQASLDNAQTQLKRQEQLARSSTTTEANVDNARADRDTAKAQLDSARASLKEAQINLGYTTITAPFDGYVTEHQADVGALVGSGNPTTLATIVRLDPIHVSFSISDTDMLRIRQQLRAEGKTPKDLGNVPIEAATKLDQDFPHRGRLDYVAPQTDAATGTLAVRAVFDNPGLDFLPNLFLHLRIPIDSVEGAPLLPPNAIGTDQQGRFVLAVGENGAVERRAVELLERSGNLQAVQGAIAAGDHIVLNAAGDVRPGETVKAQDVPPASNRSGGTSADPAVPTN